ncbi:hypothetical protein HYV43_02935 [Candidatus Micrarchaeota archaeon]|nr:hypothetical protein [Candidatus Micrarchaeota archaeon]
MVDVKLAFDAVKRGANWFVLSAYSGGSLACQLQVRMVRQKAVLLPYPHAPFSSQPGFQGKDVGKALVAYAVGFARKQGADVVVFANFPHEELAKKLAGPGRVEPYHEFMYPDHPERYQIVWN